MTKRLQKLLRLNVRLHSQTIEGSGHHRSASKHFPFLGLSNDGHFTFSDDVFTSITYNLIFTGIFSLGMALLIPTLAAMTSKITASGTGEALGIQNAANSMGQFFGPMIGGILFSFSIHFPYMLTASLLGGSAILVINQKTLRRVINT